MKYHLLEEDAGGETLPIRNMPNRRQTTNPKRPRPVAREKADPVQQLAETEGQFTFTYKAARHEAIWLLGSLGDFYENHWIEDVLRLVKGGKEANVYLCAAHPSTSLANIAAKVYRPRQVRNLRKDHLYREGRANLDGDGKIILDDRMDHAMSKRTTYGLQLLHTSWLAYELKTLQILHAAGADVPQPFASNDNAILMGYVGDEDGAAPTLNSIRLQRREVNSLFERVVHNIRLMLQNGIIHGDLSAYNILYWEGEITLIDFPQVVNPQANRSAYRIFERDVTRICEYFSSQGIRCDGPQLARQIWHDQGLRSRPEVHPALLDEESDADRALWAQTHEG